MHPRQLASHLLEAMTDTPAILLAGGRQTGKTTLARGLAQSHPGSRYVSLDDPSVRESATSDPVGFLASFDGLAVLDEVQQVPDLFPALRREIDRDRRPGRFLLTGSAQVLVMPKLAEYLVGRMEVCRMWPLGQGELEGRRSGFVDAVFAGRPRNQDLGSCSRREVLERAIRGGYPEVTSRSGSRRSSWYDAYIELLLQRDIRDLADIDRLDSMRTLLTLVAGRVGGLTNFAELARSARIPQTSLKRYFALLEGVFLVTTVPAWSTNSSKRVTRSPKLFLSDSGLLAHVLGIDLNADANRPDLLGPLIENFVALELIRQVGWSDEVARLSHFRTPAGREVDFVLESRRGRVVGVEVESAAKIGSADFRGLRALEELAGDSFESGVLLYAGSDVLSFGPRLLALPISALWTLGASEFEVRLPR